MENYKVLFDQRNYFLQQESRDQRFYHQLVIVFCVLQQLEIILVNQVFLLVLKKRLSIKLVLLLFHRKDSLQQTQI